MQCPSIGRRAGKEPNQEAIAPQPFALQARHFSEMAVLSREVRILLQGVDKHDNLIGSVVYPSSDGPDAKPTDLGKELITRGLARVRPLLQPTGIRPLSDCFTAISWGSPRCLSCPSSFRPGFSWPAEVLRHR